MDYENGMSEARELLGDYTMHCPECRAITFQLLDKRWSCSEGCGWEQTQEEMEEEQ